MIEGWQRVKPQWARHVDGYEIYSDGTYRTAHEDARGKAVVATERLVDGIVLDPTRISWEKPDGSTKRVARSDRVLIVQHCVEGLQFLGAQVTVSGR